MADPRFMFMLQIRGRLKMELQGIQFKGPPTLKTLNQQEKKNFTRRADALPWVELQIVQMLRDQSERERENQDAVRRGQSASDPHDA